MEPSTPTTKSTAVSLRCDTLPPDGANLCPILEAARAANASFRSAEVRSAHLDTVIRTALVLMLQDPANGLTEIQRMWLTTRLKTRTALSVEERDRLRAPLLAWVEARQLQIREIVEKQFVLDGNNPQMLS